MGRLLSLIRNDLPLAPEDFHGFKTTETFTEKIMGIRPLITLIYQSFIRFIRVNPCSTVLLVSYELSLHIL